MSYNQVYINMSTTERGPCTVVNATTPTIPIIVSSVATFVLSSILCFCCGLFGRTAWQRVSNRSKTASNHDTGPTYDVIAPTASVHQSKLEMKENEAYSTITASIKL